MRIIRWVQCINVHISVLILFWSIAEFEKMTPKTGLEPDKNNSFSPFDVGVSLWSCGKAQHLISIFTPRAWLNAFFLDSIIQCKRYYPLYCFVQTHIHKGGRNVQIRRPSLWDLWHHPGERGFYELQWWVKRKMLLLKYRCLYESRAIKSTDGTDAFWGRISAVHMYVVRTDIGVHIMHLADFFRILTP